MSIGALSNLLRTIHARLQVLPFSANHTMSDLRRRCESLSFFLNAGAPPLPHIEERTAFFCLRITTRFLPTIAVRPALTGEANTFCSAFETDRHAE